MATSPLLSEKLIKEGIAAQVRQRLVKERLRPTCPENLIEAFEYVILADNRTPGSYDEFYRRDVFEFVMDHWNFNPWEATS